MKYNKQIVRLNIIVDHIGLNQFEDLKVKSLVAFIINFINKEHGKLKRLVRKPHHDLHLRLARLDPHANRSTFGSLRIANLLARYHGRFWLPPSRRHLRIHRLQLSVNRPSKAEYLVATRRSSMSGTSDRRVNCTFYVVGERFKYLNSQLKNDNLANDLHTFKIIVIIYTVILLSL